MSVLIQQSYTVCMSLGAHHHHKRLMKNPQKVCKVRLQFLSRVKRNVACTPGVPFVPMLSSSRLHNLAFNCSMWLLPSLCLQSRSWIVTVRGLQGSKLPAHCL